MPAGRARSPRWKRGIRRILAALLLGPPFLLLVLNLLLATPWPRDWLAVKISARTGMEARVGRASWTPWSGAFIGGLTLLQPPPLRADVKAPLLEIRGIRAYPRWKSLVTGELEVSSVEVDRPRLVLPLEILANVVASSAGETIDPQAPPALAATVDDGPPAAAPRARAPRSAVAAPPVTGRVDRSSLDPSTTWLGIKQGELELRLAGGRLVKVTGISGSIPVAGMPAVSEFRVGGIESLGRRIASDLVLPLAWRSPELRCEAPDLRVAGLEAKLSAALGLVRGAPFGVEVLIPTQAADASRYFKTLQPRAERAGGRIQGRGLLRFPSSWLGVAELDAAEIDMSVAGQKVDFDAARAAFLLQGGGLQCPELRLTGDRMSFLGNGRFGPDGEGSAVLRAVLLPDLAEVCRQRFAVAGRPPVFAPLETPDRQFIDLRWVSYPAGQGIELGAGGPVVPVGEVPRFIDPVVAP